MPARLFGALGTGILGVILVGCSAKIADKSPSAAGDSVSGGAVLETGSFRPAEPVILAIAGRPMVLTLSASEVEAGSAGAWMPTRVPAVTFMTGEALASEMYWVRGEPPADAAMPGWLPPTYSWSALSVEEVSSLRAGVAGGTNDPLASAGFWSLLVNVPERASGRELRLDGRTLPVIWLDEPPATTDIGRSPRPRASVAAVRALGDLLRAEEADPLRRWRVRLILDRLSADRLWDGDQPPRTLEPPVLEALAAQNEWRWRAALAALARSGPDTAADVLARLTAVVGTPSGTLLPAWPLDEASALRLRNALLRREAGDEDRLNEAQAWLASMPPVLAWVIDDGPLVEEPPAVGSKTSALRRVRVGVTDLTGRRGRASVTPEGQQPRDSQMIESHETAVFSVDALVGAKPLEALNVNTGRWAGKAVFRATALSASPPGLALGPLHPMWTMPGWLVGHPGLVPADWMTAGILQRAVSDEGWEIYIECRVGTLDDGPSEDIVRVWWGAAGLADRMIEVKAPPRDRIEGDRWSASVPLPPGAISADGTVLLALERVDGRGVRSSWPRALMPGDAEPYRALIDLKSWGDLGEPNRSGAR